jgi:phage gpG-like protein
MVDVNVTLRRSSGAGRDLVEKWGRALRMPADAVERIGQVVEDSVKASFETRRDPWGAPWQPVSPVTEALSRKLGSGTEATLAAKIFRRVTSAGKRVVVGLASPAARVRQSGRANNRIFGKAAAPIPARPVLPVRGRKVELPDALNARMREALSTAIRAAVGSR